MTNQNDNRNQAQTAGKADTEFGADANMSKKARKKAAREKRKNG